MIIIEYNGKISDRIIGQNLHNSYDHDHQGYDQDHENSSNDDMMIIKERIVGQNLHSNNDHYHELVAKETTPKNDDLLVKWQFWPRVLMKTFAKWKIMEKLIMIILSVTSVPSHSPDPPSLFSPFSQPFCTWIYWQDL